MKLYTQSFKACSQKTADEIKDLLTMKPTAILGLATGSTPLPLYERLVQLFKGGQVDFSHASTYNLDEYVGLAPEHPCSYHYYMKENLFNHINLKKNHGHLPHGMADDMDVECSRYEENIVSDGGIDLQILGIGHNGHIGFNEPGTPFESRTHVIDLAPATIEANARFFTSASEVPRRAVSMGIKTIMQARRIILIVTGEDKAKILYQALYGPVTPDVPASILQLHPALLVCADPAATQFFPNLNADENTLEKTCMI